MKRQNIRQILIFEYKISFFGHSRDYVHTASISHCTAVTKFECRSCSVTLTEPADTGSVKTSAVQASQGVWKLGPNCPPPLPPPPHPPKKKGKTSMSGVSIVTVSLSWISVSSALPATSFVPLPFSRAQSLSLLSLRLRGLLFDTWSEKGLFKKCIVIGLFFWFLWWMEQMLFQISPSIVRQKWKDEWL